MPGSFFMEIKIKQPAFADCQIDVPSKLNKGSKGGSSTLLEPSIYGQALDLLVLPS